MRRAFLLFVLFILILAGCQPEEPPLPTMILTDTPAPTATSTPTEPPTPTATATGLPIPATTADDPANQAFVRLVHTIPDVTAVDIYLEGRNLVFNLGFGDATLPDGVVAGDYQLRVLPAGEDETPLLEQSISITGDTSTILLLTGTADTPVLTLHAENTDPLDTNQSRVNLIHAVARGPAVTLQQDNADLTSPLNFGQQSAPAIVPSAPASLAIQSGEQTLLTFDATLRERTNYTYILAGNANDPDSLTLVEFNSRVPGQASLRVINAAAELLDAVDIYLNDSPLAQNVPYRQVTERQSIPTDAYTLALYLTGADPTTTDPLVEAVFNINPDDVVSLIVVGSMENPRVIRYREDFTPLPPSEAAFVFINPLDTQRNVEVGYANETLTISYGQPSQPELIDDGVYDFFWYALEPDRSQGDTLENGLNIGVAAGTRYLYILTGNDEQPFILSEFVGEDQQLTEGDAAPGGNGPTEIRFVNLLRSGEPLDIFIEGEPLVQNINYGQASTAVEIAPGRRAVTARLPGTDFDLNAIAFDFIEGVRYNLYAYGEDSAFFSLLVEQNPFFNTPEPGIASIRLINTSNVVSRLSLQYDESLGLVFTPTPDPTVAADLGTFRQPLPPGARPVIGATLNSAASAVNRIGAGTYDLFIIDDINGLVAQTLRNITLVENTQYDVVAFQFEDSDEVAAFIVSYPLPE